MAPVIEIGGAAIPSYTLMILIGFGAGYAVVARRGTLLAIRPDEVAATYLLAAIGAFLGGKTFYIVQGLPEFFERHASSGLTFAEYVNQAGLVFYGGMFGCLLFIRIAAFVFRTPFHTSLDAVLPALPLAQAFGRIGCFLVGCCWGVPSSLGFCLNASPYAPHDVRLFPVQLAESVCTLMIFLVLWRLARRPQPPFLLLGVYFLGYGCARFALEFLRYDTGRGIIGPFSVSQWISMGVAACGAWLISRSASTRTHTTKDLSDAS